MNNIVSMLSRALSNASALSTVSKTSVVKSASNNPFGNPFVTGGNSSSAYENYAKNRPQRGGYFAGYYNNKPNIVGQRLFIEV